MKFAKDFRRLSREALSGKWLTAVLAGLVTAVLTGEPLSGFKVNFDASNLNVSINYAGQKLLEIGNSSDILGAVKYLIGPLAGVVLAFALVFFVIGSIVSVGYARFNLDLVDRRDAVIETLFKYFAQWKTAVAAKLLRTFYTFLWTLLFIVPGVVAEYSYAMTSYIIAENPEISASEAIEQSKEMMRGNRFRLFCLRMSFIGWDILAICTLGVGNLWLIPYRQAATAAFYREVSGTENIECAEFEVENEEEA